MTEVKFRLVDPPTETVTESPDGFVLGMTLLSSRFPPLSGPGAQRTREPRSSQSFIHKKSRNTSLFKGKGNSTKLNLKVVNVEMSPTRDVRPVL